MSKTIKEVLQLHWMDGAKLSGGSAKVKPSNINMKIVECGAYAVLAVLTASLWWYAFH